jgi:hypothetical protein
LIQSAKLVNFIRFGSPLLFRGVRGELIAQRFSQIESIPTDFDSLAIIDLNRFVPAKLLLFSTDNQQPTTNNRQPTTDFTSD